MAEPIKKINRVFYNADKLFRLQYLTEKRKALNDIVKSYMDATNYVGRVIAGSKYEFTPNYQPLIIRDAFNALRETEPEIIKSFQEGFTRVNEVAIRNVLDPIAKVGLNVDPALIDQVAKVAQAKAVAQIYEPSDLSEIPLSQRIWNKDDRVNIVTIIQDGIKNQESPFQIADKLQSYSKSGENGNGGKGGNWGKSDGEYNATRLAYTELTSSFYQARMDTLKDWNNNPMADYQIGIEQYLSPTHAIRDICDDLKGKYLAENAPPIPRHPNCECGCRFIVIDSSTMREIDINYSRLSRKDISYKK